MKTEFVLSVDNYKELGEARLRTPSRALAAAAAFCGLGLILFGYCLLHFWPNRDPRAGLLSLMVGLISTLLAAVLAFFPRRVRNRKAEELLQSEYERFFKGARSFEFDEIGWKYKSDQGEDMRKWDDLTIFREHPSILILGTSGTNYLLPKSAFSAQELEFIRNCSIKALKAPGVLLAARILPSPKEYVASLISHHWRTNWKTMALSYITALVILIIVISVGEGAFAFQPSLVGFALGLSFVGECAYYLWLYYKQFRKLAPARAEIMKDRIAFSGDNSRWVVKYEWFWEIRETRSVFNLYLNPKLFYLVSKKGFTTDQLNSVRGLFLSRHSQSEVTT